MLGGIVVIIIIVVIDAPVCFVQSGAKRPIFEGAGMGVEDLFYIIAQGRRQDGTAAGAAYQAQWILNVVDAFPVFRKPYGKNCAAVSALEIKIIQIDHTCFLRNLIFKQYSTYRNRFLPFVWRFSKLFKSDGMNCKVPKFCEIEQKQRSCAEKTIFCAPSVWLFVYVIEQSVKTMAIVLRKIMAFS